MNTCFMNVFRIFLKMEGGEELTEEEEKLLANIPDWEVEKLREQARWLQNRF